MQLLIPDFIINGSWLFAEATYIHPLQNKQQLWKKSKLKDPQHSSIINKNTHHSIYILDHVTNSTLLDPIIVPKRNIPLPTWKLNPGLRIWAAWENNLQILSLQHIIIDDRTDEARVTLHPLLRSFPFQPTNLEFNLSMIKLKSAFVTLLVTIGNPRYLWLRSMLKRNNWSKFVLFSPSEKF